MELFKFKFHEISSIIERIRRSTERGMDNITVSGFWR
jgi:hypothetical protein